MKNQLTIKVGGKPVDDENIEPQDSSTMSAKRSGKGSQSGASNAAPSALSNSQFAGLSDNGLGDKASVSNWLFERHACTIGCIKIESELANKTEINAMVDFYDQMTAFYWSPGFKEMLSEATVDDSLKEAAIREELCERIDGLNCQSSESDAFKNAIKFISDRLSALLHAVNGARSCDDNAQVRGANEADRRHQWDDLLLNFFQPFEKKRDVLLERQLNLARNLAADSSCVTWVRDAVFEYEALCLEQCRRFDDPADSVNRVQAELAHDQANTFSRYKRRTTTDQSKNHSHKDPITGKCDAILVVPISGGAAAMLQGISSSDEQEKCLEDFMLVQDPKPEKLDASTGENSLRTGKAASQKHKSSEALKVSDEIQQIKQLELNSKAVARQLRDEFFRCYPDGKPASPKSNKMPSKNTSADEPIRGADILLPVLVAEYKKMGALGVSTAMNQTRIYQVSAVTFLSTLGITDKPVFGLVVTGTLGAITMAWKTNDQIYVMERNVRHYDIKDPIQALQFVSILPRLADYGVKLLQGLSKGQPVISDVKWSKLCQRKEDEARRKENAAKGGTKKE